MSELRDKAWSVLKKYNKDHFHLQHALTVENVMKWFSVDLGYESEADFWAVVGLLHDIDFELYPEEHCKKAASILKEEGFDEKLIHAVCSHGYSICSDVEPVHEMEKVLFAVDELSGLIGAAILMRPSKSTKDLEVSSLKKKFKDKKFAAGCDRSIIEKGATLLSWDLPKLMEKTIIAMRESEDLLNKEIQSL